VGPRAGLDAGRAVKLKAKLTFSRGRHAVVLHLQIGRVYLSKIYVIFGDILPHTFPGHYNNRL
jgi:hypothetical protein